MVMTWFRITLKVLLLLFVAPPALSADDTTPLASNDHSLEPGTAEGHVESKEFSNNTQAPITTYQRPVRAKHVPAEYPWLEQARAGEGWVALHFMVSPEGKPYEIAVTDSVGGQRFEAAAIKALENTVYKPATLNGRPIYAGELVSYAFSIEGGVPGARPSFVSRWRKVEKNINANNREEATRLMQELKPISLYEDAYYQLCRALFALKWVPAKK